MLFCIGLVFFGAALRAVAGGEFRPLGAHQDERITVIAVEDENALGAGTEQVRRRVDPGPDQLLLQGLLVLRRRVAGEGGAQQQGRGDDATRIHELPPLGCASSRVARTG
jgi:hypothetical protein